MIFAVKLTSPPNENNNSNDDSSNNNNNNNSTDLVIFDHDFVFWLGDLNYRLDLDSLDTAYDLIERGDFKGLLAADQLMYTRSRGDAFAGFKEGEITFLPTYKFITGTLRYDRRPDKKLRMPAWCDRIQYFAPHNEVKQHMYDSCDLIGSDHKPVMALYTATSELIIQGQPNSP